ncbi:zinc-dependent peptidase [bacterium]|nr:zinc-dependent peptidase [bacterium]
MQIHDNSQIQFAKITSGLLSIALFGLIYALSNSIILAILAVPLIILGVYHVMLLKMYRRKAIIATPFPENWRAVLEQKATFYRALSAAEKRRFEQLTQIFLSEQRIVGIEPVVIDDELRLMVAAGAITLVFYRPEWEFRSFRDILIYEDAFDPESFESAPDKAFLGMVGTQMPILLSKKHLQAGFRHAGDGFNVAYHEFAHIIDLHDVGTQSNPLHGIFAQALVQSEMKKIRHGQSVLRQYGAHNEAEFFAVVTEFFFERPAVLYAHHKELYLTLARVYNYDPLMGKKHGTNEREYI